MKFVKKYNDYLKVFEISYATAVSAEDKASNLKRTKQAAYFKDYIDTALKNPSYGIEDPKIEFVILSNSNEKYSVKGYKDLISNQKKNINQTLLNFKSSKIKDPNSIFDAVNSFSVPFSLTTNIFQNEVPNYNPSGRPDYGYYIEFYTNPYDNGDAKASGYAVNFYDRQYSRYPLKKETVNWLSRKNANKVISLYREFVEDWNKDFNKVIDASITILNQEKKTGFLGLNKKHNENIEECLKKLEKLRKEKICKDLGKNEPQFIR